MTTYTITPSGAIHVQVITDGEIWRCAVDPGDTQKVIELLGDEADAAMQKAGENLGGWSKLESDRTAKLEADKNKPKPPDIKPLADALTAALIKKGVVTQADVDAEK